MPAPARGSPRTGARSPPHRRVALGGAARAPPRERRPGPSLAVTLWSPHRAYDKYELTKLKDPEWIDAHPGIVDEMAPVT